MLIIFKWPLYPTRNKPMTVSVAAGHALSDTDPEARQQATAEMLARLVTVLHQKGTLLPHEVIEVLGAHSYEEYNAD